MKQGDWVTDGDRVGVIMARPEGKQVFWLGGDIGPALESHRILTSEEAEQALASANEKGGTA